jgi:hypothetical protein
VLVAGGVAKCSLFSIGRRQLTRARNTEDGFSAFQLAAGDGFAPRVTVVAMCAGVVVDLGDDCSTSWCAHVLAGRLRVAQAHRALSAFPGDLISGTIASPALAQADSSFLLITTPTRAVRVE